MSEDRKSKSILKKISVLIVLVAFIATFGFIVGFTSPGFNIYEVLYGSSYSSSSNDTTVLIAQKIMNKMR